MSWVSVRCRKARLNPTHPARAGSRSSYWCLFGWEGRPSTLPTSNVSRFSKQCQRFSEKTHFLLSRNWHLKLFSPLEHLTAGLLYRNHRGETQTFSVLHRLPRWELKVLLTQVFLKVLHLKKHLWRIHIVLTTDFRLHSHFCFPFFNAHVVSCLTDGLSLPTPMFMFCGQKNLLGHFACRQEHNPTQPNLLNSVSYFFVWLFIIW